MKKIYISPETEVLSMVMESVFICTSNKNGSSSDMTTEDLSEGDFWN